MTVAISVKPLTREFNVDFREMSAIHRIQTVRGQTTQVALAPSIIDVIAEKSAVVKHPAYTIHETETFIVLNKDGQLFSGLRNNKGPWDKKDAHFLDVNEIKAVVRKDVTFSRNTISNLIEDIKHSDQEDKFDGATIISVSGLTTRAIVNAADFANAALSSYDMLLTQPSMVRRGINRAMSHANGSIDAPLKKFKKALFETVAQHNVIRLSGTTRRATQKRFG